MAVVVVAIRPSAGVGGHRGTQATDVVGVSESGQRGSVARRVRERKEAAVGVVGVGGDHPIRQRLRLQPPVLVVRVGDLGSVGVGNRLEESIDVIAVRQLVALVVDRRLAAAPDVIGEGEPMSVGRCDPADPVRRLVDGVHRRAGGVRHARQIPAGVVLKHCAGPVGE